MRRGRSTCTRKLERRETKEGIGREKLEKREQRGNEGKREEEEDRGGKIRSTKFIFTKTVAKK